MDTDIAALQQSFLALSKRCGQLQLERQEYIAAFGGIEVLLKCVDSLPGVLRKNTSRYGMLKRTKNSLQFEWALSAEGWDDVVELIKGVLSSDQPCHQYLTGYMTRYRQEDADVVLSRGEDTDENLQEYCEPDSY
jgi:hypothetical protein